MPMNPDRSGQDGRQHGPSLGAWRSVNVAAFDQSEEEARALQQARVRPVGSVARSPCYGAAAQLSQLMRRAASEVTDDIAGTTAATGE